MQISPVTTRADLEDLQSVMAAALAHDFVALPADPIEERAPWLERDEIAGERTVMHVGRDGGVPVAALSMSLPVLDNLRVVNAELEVHPDHRGRGFGRSMGEHLVAETRAHGRDRVFSAVSTTAGRQLAEALGAKPVLDDVRRVLDLHAFPPLARPAAPPGYRVVMWQDRAPDEWVEGAAYLNGRMTIDAPMGEMGYEPEKWDAARYREREQAAADRRRRMVVAAAVHESGQVAGITEIGISLTAPEIGYQWDTIVDPDHRGHGLGLLLKHWNHAQLVEVQPQVRWVNTWNAASNSFMIRVNEAVGYRVMDTWTEYQLDL